MTAPHGTRSPRSDELRERIRSAGLACGFDQVGFAPADPPAHADTYRRWLDAGYHGDMAYMAREDSVRCRLDPREALEGCRTVIVTTLVYVAARLLGVSASAPWLTEARALFERGDPAAAVTLFRGAIESDPKFADAYFNLAMAYEQLGKPESARPFWKSYVELEPEGTWAEIARRHL